MWAFKELRNVNLFLSIAKCFEGEAINRDNQLPMDGGIDADEEGTWKDWTDRMEWNEWKNKWMNEWLNKYVGAVELFSARKSEEGRGGTHEGGREWEESSLVEELIKQKEERGWVGTKLPKARRIAYGMGMHGWLKK